MHRMFNPLWHVPVSIKSFTRLFDRVSCARRDGRGFFFASTLFEFIVDSIAIQDSLSLVIAQRRLISYIAYIPLFCGFIDSIVYCVYVSLPFNIIRLAATRCMDGISLLTLSRVVLHLATGTVKWKIVQFPPR